MDIALFANPGQTVVLAVQVVDGYGERVDGYDGYGPPRLMSVIFPNGSAALGYPPNMTKAQTGLYTHALTLPTGPSSLGTFLASARWVDPSGTSVHWQLFSIQVALPFGNSSVSPV